MCYNINKANFTDKDITKAVSLVNCDPEFRSRKDQIYYSFLLSDISEKIVTIVLDYHQKFKDDRSLLKSEIKDKKTSKERKSDITFLCRCIDHGKQVLKSKKKLTKFKKQIEQIINKLLQAYLLKRMVWIYRGKKFYNKKTLNRYFEKPFTCDYVCLAIDCLVKLDMIDDIGFKKGSRYKKGQASRYILSGLCQYFDRIEDKYRFRLYNHKESVVLKNEKAYG